ncbi:MAG: SPOR domain-containing protein, partial [Alphaproteobacteria bacterium]
ERYVQTVGMLNVAWGKTQNENLPSIEDDPEDNPKIAHKLNLNPRLKAASAAQKNTTPKTRVVAQPKQQLAKAQPVAAQPKTDLQTIWGVQIGAYRSPTMARNAAQKAQARLPKEIAESGKVSVLPAVVSKQKKLFRARIVGFSKTEAEGACQALKRTKTQCVLVQAGRAAVAKTNRSHDG